MWSESKFHFIKISERSIEAEVKISSIKTFCIMIFKYGISLPNAESESNNLLTTNVSGVCKKYHEFRFSWCDDWTITERCTSQIKWIKKLVKLNFLNYLIMNFETWLFNAESVIEIILCMKGCDILTFWMKIRLVLYLRQLASLKLRGQRSCKLRHLISWSLTFEQHLSF